jgi:hypothetical protein
VVQCCLGSGLSVGGIRDVKFDDVQVRGMPEGLSHALGVAAGRDHLVAGSQGCLGDIQSETPAGTGDKPRFAQLEFPLIVFIIVLAVPTYIA